MVDERGRAAGGADRHRLWGTSMEQTNPGASATGSGCCMVDERGRATGGADRHRLWGTQIESRCAVEQTLNVSRS